jgi:hypothetical protein
MSALTLRRCICHLDNSMNPARPHNSDTILKKAVVVEASSITTRYAIRISGPPIEIESNDGTSHVVVEKESLKIYVRADAAKAWQLWNLDLPEQLVKCFRMEHSTQSHKLITSVLNIPFESLESLLIQRGIISGHDAENWCEDGINEDHEDHEEQGADTPRGTWPLTPTKPLKRNMPKQRSHNSVTTSGHNDETSPNSAESDVLTTRSSSSGHSSRLNSSCLYPQFPIQDPDATPTIAVSTGSPLIRGRVSSQYTRQNATALREGIQKLARDSRMQLPVSTPRSNSDTRELRSALFKVSSESSPMRGSGGRTGAFGARQLLNELNDDNSEEKAVIGYLGEQFV